MKGAIITLGSVTYAIKCRKMLLSKGIKSKLVKIDAGIADGGCSYGLEIPKDSYLYAVMHMRQENIAYKVYRN